MSRQLTVILALLAVTGGALALWPRASHDTSPVHLERLPALVDRWIAREGVPEDVLPIDPRALESLRRTYTRNGDAVMLSVARYPSWNHPDHRPLADFLVSTRGAGEVTHETLRIDVNGVPGRPRTAAPVNLISLQRRNRPLAVAYWYQLADEPITDEYGLRLRLFVDTLRSRPRAFVLIRLAAEQRTPLTEFLHVFYPRLKNYLAS